MRLSTTSSQWAWGLPRPRPAGPGGASMELRGFLMVSSTDRMRQAASDAAVSALMRTIEGSHTQSTKLSAMSSLLMSTPYHIPPCGHIAKNKLWHKNASSGLEMKERRWCLLPVRVWHAVCSGCWWRQSQRCRTAVGGWPPAPWRRPRSVTAVCQEWSWSNPAGTWTAPSRWLHHQQQWSHSVHAYSSQLFFSTSDMHL